MELPHGTQSGYSYWKCRCPECRAAARAWEARKRASRKARALAGDPAVPHGTVGGYSKWSCRCTECKAAAAWARKPFRVR